MLATIFFCGSELNCSCEARCGKPRNRFNLKKILSTIQPIYLWLNPLSWLHLLSRSKFCLNKQINLVLINLHVIID